MSTQYRLSTGEQLQNFCVSTYGIKIPATTNKQLTIPNLNNLLGQSMSHSNAQVIVVITAKHATANVWVALNATPVIPSATSLTANPGELIPFEGTITKQAAIGDVINIISDTADVLIGVALYASV